MTTNRIRYISTTLTPTVITVEVLSRPCRHIWLGVRCRFHSRLTMISHAVRDRKSTRLNSSHVAISYAVFCLKKKNNKRTQNRSLNTIGSKTTSTPRRQEKARSREAEAE